jgi:hypothetical protein
MNNIVKQFLFSLLAAAIFLILAVGSDSNTNTRQIDYWAHEKEDLGNGKTRSRWKRAGYEKTEEGTFDKYYSKQGQFTIRVIDKNNREEYVEVANFQNDVRHGMSEKKYADGRVKIFCYDRGYPVSCNKSASISVKSNHQSAYNILENEYPWYLFYLNAYGFEEKHVESFMNRIGTLMADYEFDNGEFDDYYNDALKKMEEEEDEFVEIIEMNADLAFLEGRGNIKSNGLRMALIDKYRTTDKTTFATVQSNYPAYLNEVTSFSSPGATVKDFELFCHELDTRMVAIGPLNPDDTYFTDSLDYRLYLALFSILMENQLVNALMMETKSAALNKRPVSISHLQRQTTTLLNRIIYGGDKQIAAAVAAAMMQQDFLKGDIIRICVKKAYSATSGGGNGFAGEWEYWFNNNYTARVKSGMSVLPGMAFGNNISTNSLEAGIHTLFIRFRDEKGLWSVPQSFIFFKGGQLLSNFEYWFNNDYDNKINVETVRSDSLRLNTTIQTNHLGNGMHWVHFRFKDASGIYAPLQSHLFWKTGQRLVAYEYWFDNETNNRVPGQLAGNNEEEWIKIIEIAPIGFEKLYVRYKDSGGLWSPVVSMDAPVPVSVATYKQLQNVFFYPNPASGKLNISFASESDGDMVFTLYDSQGKIVLTRSLDTRANIEQTFMVEVGDLLNGLYLCILETNNERSVFKAIINR